MSTITISEPEIESKIKEEKDTYTYDEALQNCLDYFNGNELASRVFLDKYALRDNENRILENTPEKMHRRIAKEFARIEKEKYNKSKHLNPLTEDEIFSYLDKFSQIIPQGSPMYGIGNNYQIISLSNCFVNDSPKDSYGGILKADEELAQISKRRGGVGLDISNLRPNKAPTKNSSRTSTGIIPFMCRYSNTIREVGQDGRRGAEMLTLSIHHPESVIPFDDEKDEEKPIVVQTKDFSFETTSKWYNPKKLDFVTSKYDPTKVTGANISLRLTDDFLNSVENADNYQQRWPVDKNEFQSRVKNNQFVLENIVDAKSCWNKIVRSAWQTAEPGLLFWDNILRESIPNCYKKFGFADISCNPCSEILLCAYDSCRLLLLNLFGFIENPYTSKAKFNYKKVFEAAKVAQRLMDDLVDLEMEKINKIISKIKNDPEDEEIKSRELNLWEKILNICKKGRRTGLGITALGDTIYALGYGYGTDNGIETTQKIYRTLKFASYQSSTEMAKELSPFTVWDWELEKDNPFLNRMKEESIDLGDEVIYGKDIINHIISYGRRNIANLTTAPCGSVSLLAKLVNRFGTTSGVEPEYDWRGFVRRKKINPSDKNARTDYVDQNGDHWQEFTVYPSGIQEWMDITGNKDVKKSPWFKQSAVDIDWRTRVKIQSVASKEVDHSISSTVNLPNDATVEDVKGIYEMAWKEGIKGITIYRDGCRSGVLINKNNKKNKITDNAPKRPKTLDADAYHCKVKGEEYFVFVGMLNDYPYECFGGKNGLINKKFKTAKIEKQKRGHYSAIFEDGSKIDNIADLIEEDEEAICRLTSLALRHGNDISFLVHQLEKTKGEMTSLAKAIARQLKKYIDDGTEIKGEECPQCTNNLVRENGCIICKNCGYSKCN